MVGNPVSFWIIQLFDSGPRNLIYQIYYTVVFFGPLGKSIGM